MRPDRPQRVLAVALLFALGACTAGRSEPPPAATTPAATPRGTLLVAMGGDFSDMGLVRLNPDGPSNPVRITGGALGRFDFPSGAVLTPEGTAFVLVSDVEGDGFFRADIVASMLFELRAGAPARQIGPRLGAGLATLVGVSGDTAVVAFCGDRHAEPAILALDLEKPGKWRHVVGACEAALSPEGSRVAFVRHAESGESVWEVPLDRSRPPARVFGPAALAPLARSGLGRPDVALLSWGAGGLAAVVQDRREDVSRSGLVLVAEGGTPRAVPLGAGQPQSLAWQPRGNLFAFTECSECAQFFRRVPQGELFLVDPADGRLREVAATRDLFNGLAWSPDGSLLVTQPSRGDLLFVDPSGRQVLHEAVDAAPLAWARA